MNLSLADILKAQRHIRGVADTTPMIASGFMSRFCGREFLLKLETMQPIGAFKLRGAMNAIANLPDRARGVTCCSTGNHGRGVAFAAARRGVRAVICMSSLVPEVKVDGIRALGAEIHISGTSQDNAQVASDQLADKEGLISISPFDDPMVIAGQGTIGLEMLGNRPDLKAILVPLSGGGLAAGVALAAKTINPQIKVFGISMDRGAAMHASIMAGHPVEVTEVASLADSLGGGIGLDNRYSFSMCRDLLDDTILVSEEEIRDAMQMLFHEDSMVAEGASVVGIAAVLSGKLRLPDGPIATIITGRNIDMMQFYDVVGGKDIQLGDILLKGRAYRKASA